MRAHTHLHPRTRTCTHTSGQDRYINAYVPIYAALATLYAERAGLRKEEEEQGKVSDRKQAEAYGKKHAEMEEGAKSRAEATAALAQEKLKEIKL